jgi:hypothetical protein
MKIGQSRCAAIGLIGLLSLLLLAACASTAPTTPSGGNAGPTPTVTNVTLTSTVSQVNPTSTANQANSVLATYVGKWVSHDDQLTIAANGTGVENWNSGPCTGGISGLCSGIGDLTFTVNGDGSLAGTYQSVTYQSSSGPVPSNYQPAPGYPVVGNTISLKHNGADLLAAMVNGNSFNYCDPTALSQGQCGA